MKEMMEQIDQRYLLGELMPDSVHLEDQIYRELIRKSNKSVIERIRAIEDEKKNIGNISRAGYMKSKRRSQGLILCVKIIKKH